MAQDPEDEGPAKTVFEPLPPTASGRSAEDDWFSGGAQSEPEEAPAEDAPPAAPKGRRGRKAAAPASTILQPSAPPAAPAPSVPPPGTGQPFAAPGAVGSGRVAIGSVLNHIYEVRRFIGRGGMGEVYEGVNVNTDERVAIKVVLPHLSADPNVQAMFRKEARTLTRLSHPALVQYRVLANEPVLGVLYIVTDFIDGLGLDQLIGKLKLSQADLLSLMKRLAEGLKVAHDLGAIHRDISPDNVLLPGERVDLATIIDFGIAKDLDASHATIVGDGFAGKLAFVAPEQFGDFGREIGPWTDIYSLGLVMLAVAGGKNADMGTTLVEAVDRRRAGPDLSLLPPALQPLFGKMLAADPKARFRSMDEVLEAIAGVGTAAPLAMGKPAPAKAEKPPKPTPAPKPPKPPKPARAPGEKPAGFLTPPIIAGAVGAAILAVGVPLVIWMMSGDGSSAAGGGAAASSIDRSLQAVSCSWLEQDGGGDSTRIKGAAQAGFEGPASQRVKGADLSGVLFIERQSCDLLEAVRPLKAATVAGAEWVKAASPSFTPGRQAECGGDPRQALVFIDVDTATASGEDMALYLMRPNGVIQPVFRGRSQIQPGAGLISKATPAGPNRTRIGLCNDLQGPHGLLAVRGAGPFTAEAGGPIADRLADEAKARGWSTQMDWYTVEAPSAAPAPTAVVAPPAPPVVAAPPPKPKAEPKPRPKREVAKAEPKPRPKPVEPKPAPAPAPKQTTGCSAAWGC